MKTHLIIFLTAFFVAIPVFGQQKNLTLHFKDVTIKKVLDEIKKTGGYSYWFDADDLDVKRKVTVQVKNKPIGEILSIILKDTGTTYKINGSHIIISKKVDISPAGETDNSVKKKKITGIIRDERGEPIIGATIVQKGASMGVVSDIDGKFAMMVSEDAELKVSFIGYLSRTVAVKGKTSFRITLQEDVRSLDEVVVIAYGTQKKETVTGALSTISNKELTKIPVANVTNLLAGAMPGVTAVQSTGQPGKDAASIYVRGCGSLNNLAAKPLILVDGVERDFSAIDANEIEQISVLKDASSTAVFGVKGANGVVLVTTRRGSIGKPSIAVSTTLSMQQPISLVRQADSYTYATFWNTKKRLDNVTDSKLYFTREDVEAFRTGADPIMYPNMDWGDYMFNDLSLQSKNNVNISGGNEFCKYFVSLGYLYQNGILKQLGYLPYNNNYRYDRYNYRTNLDFNLSKTTTLKLNLGGSIEKVKEPNTKVNFPWVYAQIWALPFAGPGLIDGKRTIVAQAMFPALQGEIVRDGLDVFSSGGYHVNNKMLMNMDLDLVQKLDFITKGLSIGIKGAYDNNFNLNKNRSGGGREYQVVSYKSSLDGSNLPMTHPDYDKTIIYRPAASNSPLTYSEDYNTDRNWYVEARLNYDRKFGDHKVTALMLYNQSCNHYPLKRDGSTQADYPFIPRCYVGVVGRATYDYRTKYLLDVNMGYNGSENFAPGKTRFGLFPSFSGGWVVTAENFMKKQKIVDYLKFRVSWGRVCSDVGSDTRFMYMPAVWTENGSYSFGVDNPVGTPAYGIGTMGNELVSWETSDKQNYGIDTRFLNGHLSLSADFFIEHRKGILIRPNSTPAIIAMGLPDLNLGKVDNRGYELTLGWRDEFKDFSYYLNGNVSYAKNKIVFMDEIPNEYAYMNQTGGSTERYTGQFRFDRLYQYSDFIDDGKGNLTLKPELDQPYVKVYPGDAKYFDLNGDKIVDNNDKEVTGYSRRPEYMFGLNGGFEYKNFSFSMQWLGATHVTKALDLSYRIPFTDCGKRGLLDYFPKECWTPENQLGATMPRPSDTSQSWNADSSTLWLRDASYIRLKSVNLSYTLNNRALRKKLGIKSLVFSLSGYNLLTFSPLKIVDPEEQAGQYPLTKLYNIGMTINF